MRLFSYMLDLLIPGLGLAFSGKIKRGLFYAVLFSCLCVSCLCALCHLGWHPFLALVVLGSADLALVIFALLEDRGSSTRLSFGALVVAVCCGVVFAGVVFFFKPSCGFVVVQDACEFPGLFPNEVLIFHKTKGKGETKAGDLVVFEDGDRGLGVARIVAMGKGMVEVLGPMVSINQQNIETVEAGQVRLLNKEMEWEVDNLVLYLEDLGEDKHPVFYKKGVIMAPKKSEIGEMEVAILCDNRSTASIKGASNLFIVPRDLVLGYPGRIVWSFSNENKRLRLERIGAIWR